MTRRHLLALPAALIPAVPVAAATSRASAIEPSLVKIITSAKVIDADRMIMEWRLWDPFAKRESKIVDYADRGAEHIRANYAVYMRVLLKSGEWSWYRMLAENVPLYICYDFLQFGLVKRGELGSLPDALPDSAFRGA